MSSLFVFVEGSDDERFFRRVLCPCLEQHYDRVRIVRYAQTRNRKIRNFIHTLEQRSTEYVLVRDSNHYPCVTAAKRGTARRYGIGDEQRIMVVKPEIEAWYVAGLDLQTLLRLANEIELEVPDRVTKEWLNSVIPPEMPRSTFMAKILDEFDLAVARQRSESLRYFLKRYC